MNYCNFSGKLTKEGELSYTNSNKAKVTFTKT